MKIGPRRVGPLPAPPPRLAVAAARARRFTPADLVRGLAPVRDRPGRPGRRLPPLHVQRGGANGALAAARCWSGWRLRTASSVPSDSDQQRRRSATRSSSAVRLHAVVQHHRAERAGHRERLGAGLGRLARALLVDQAAALLHPHVRAARAAAERALAAALHLDRLTHRGHQLARVAAARRCAGPGSRSRGR